MDGNYLASLRAEYKSNCKKFIGYESCDEEMELAEDKAESLKTNGIPEPDSDGEEWCPPDADAEEECSKDDDLSEAEYSVVSSLSEFDDDDGSLGDDSSVGSTDTVTELMEYEDLPRSFANDGVLLSTGGERVTVGGLVKTRREQFLAGLVSIAKSTCSRAVSGLLSLTSRANSDGDDSSVNTIDEIMLYCQSECSEAAVAGLRGLSLQEMREMEPLLTSPSERRAQELGRTMGLAPLSVKRMQKDARVCERRQFPFLYYSTDGSFYSDSLAKAMKHCKVPTVNLPHSDEARALAGSLGYDPLTHGAYSTNLGAAVSLHLPNGTVKLVGGDQLVLMEEGGPPDAVIGMADTLSYLTDPDMCGHAKSNWAELKANVEKLKNGSIDSFLYRQFRIRLHDATLHPPFANGRVAGYETVWARLRPPGDEARSSTQSGGQYHLSMPLPIGAEPAIGWTDARNGTQTTHAASGNEVSKAVFGTRGGGQRLVKSLKDGVEDEVQIKTATVRKFNSDDGPFKSFSTRKKEAEAEQKPKAKKTASEKTASKSKKRGAKNDSESKPKAKKTASEKTASKSKKRGAKNDARSESKPKAKKTAPKRSKRGTK